MFRFRGKLRKFSFLFIFLVLLFFQTDFQIVKALPMENYQSELIVEELRLLVPSKFKDVWLKAEKEIWDPWLSFKDGFLGRQIFWDKEKEQALILVNWKNKKLWKSISISEINDIQKKYEDTVKSSLNLSENPFKIIYEAELDKQG